MNELEMVITNLQCELIGEEYELMILDNSMLNRLGLSEEYGIFAENNILDSIEGGHIYITDNDKIEGVRLEMELISYDVDKYFVKVTNISKF